MFSENKDLDVQQTLLDKTEPSQNESSCQSWRKKNPKKANAVGGVVVIVILGGVFLLAYFLSNKEYFSVVSLTNESKAELYDNSPDLYKIFTPQVVNKTFLPSGEVSFNVTGKNDYVHWQVIETDNLGNTASCEIKAGTNTESSAASTTDCKTISVQLGQCSYYPLSSSSRYAICDVTKQSMFADSEEQKRVSVFLTNQQGYLRGFLGMFSGSKEQEKAFAASTHKPS